MYERKTPVDMNCPLRLTISLIGAKWKSCILDELRHRSLRPSELHRIFPEATPRVLDLQLKELAEDGLVSKTIYPELPPRSEYTITPLGRTLIPIIDAMMQWGTRTKRCSVRSTAEASSRAGSFRVAWARDVFSRRLQLPRRLLVLCWGYK